MQKRRLIELGLTILVFSIYLEAPIQAQSTNDKAIRAFNLGVQEEDAEKRISFYKQALEYDPDFVEALYNLGMFYKQEGQHKIAESYLSRAAQVRRNGTSDELKTRILFHLAVVQKQLGDYVACEQTLIRAKGFARERSIQSQITFELGRVYSEMRRFPEALAILQEGKKKFKNNGGFFENLIRIVETEQEVIRVEAELNKAIENGSFAQAQALVQRLKTIKPNHPGLDEKSALVDSLINSKAKEDFLQDMYQMAEQYVAQGNLEKAVSTYELLLQNDPNNTNAAQKLEQLRTAYDEQQKSARLQSEYSAGAEAMQEKNWTRAIIAFEKVLEIDPNYKDAKGQLRQANRNVESESTETIIRQYYIDGVAAMNRKDLNAALASFEKVHSLNPSYKDTQELIEQLKASQTASRSAPSAASDEYFKSIYDEAVTAMSEEDWMQAMLTLEKLRYLAPNDHNVLNLLIQAKEKLKTSKQSETLKTANTGYGPVFYIGSAVVAVVVLPVFGFIVLSPTSRARLQYLRGNYMKAAQLYERILSKHPERLKIYTTLANIYLMLGRNDDRALRVFKMLIDLNLAKHIHPQINSVLSQKYLNDGRAEDDAITILENELKAEQENKKSNNSV